MRLVEKRAAGIIMTSVHVVLCLFSERCCGSSIFPRLRAAALLFSVRLDTYHSSDWRPCDWQVFASRSLLLFTMLINT
eukprot:2064656-Amphidinium_carterae.1